LKRFEAALNGPGAAASVAAAPSTGITMSKVSMAFIRIGLAAAATARKGARKPIEASNSLRFMIFVSLRYEILVKSEL
jgi:hypothetical protein